MANDDRERMEREIAEGDGALTRTERHRVSDHQRLSAVTIFAIIRREGEEELHRPVNSLWWSGIAAGICLSTSVLAQGLLHHELAGNPWRGVIEDFGYALGFVLVVLSRLQLFTENTISVVLPVLAEPTLDKFKRSARLWAIVLAANLVGTFATAFIALELHTVGPGPAEAMLEIAREFTAITGWQALARGIPAGFYVAAIVWMMPSSKGFEMLVVALFAWLIAAGGFTHVVAGSTEVFLLALHGDVGLLAAVGSSLLPTLVGNVIGGTGLFALLAYGQIHAEL